MSILHNVLAVKHSIAKACERSGREPENVTVVAVTKTVDSSAVTAAFQAGIRQFGENRVQDANIKLAELSNIRNQSTWHMIGHLQTNKVKTALRLFDIIQSIDSLKLGELINRSIEQKVQVLLQVNLASEASKGGFSMDEIPEAKKVMGKMPNLEIKGLMTIAPQVNDPEKLRPLFHRLREMNKFLELEELSMGMTDDFEVAVEEGATIVRIGRAIFGEHGVAV